ncbi:MAG: hypothetical protein ACRDIU_10160 [Actinomycetota bacterium]
MRKRTPGWYVSVLTLGAELLDGPWQDREAAAHRAEEIRGQGRDASLVEVDSDGLTVIREQNDA